MRADDPNEHGSANHEVTISGHPSHAPEDGILAKAYRKVDYRLLTWYAFLFLLMKIESHNIMNAAIMNKEAQGDIIHQLGNLSSEQWAIVLSIFDYTHIPFEPISTLLVKRLSPRTWLSRIILTWGIISMCQGAVTSFSGLLACRALLGLAEAGFVSGILYHLSFWYPTERMPMRIAILFAVSELAGTVSGVLAFAISFLNGRLGLAGWQYLFILEGIPAVICGVLSMIFLPNFPTDVKFLTEDERNAILSKLPPSQPHSDERTWNWMQAKSFLKDVTTYSFLSIWICHSIGGKGVFTVLPTVIFELGIAGSTSAQLMTMPPYITGSAALLIFAYLIQKKKKNPWVIALCLEALVTACYIVLIVVEQPIVKYVIILLAATLSFAILPILWPERIRACAGATSTGLAIGITEAAAGLHGLVGPQIYQPLFGPRYRVSFSVSVGLTCLSVAGIVITWVIIRRKERRMVDDQGQDGAGTTMQIVTTVEVTSKEVTTVEVKAL